MAWAKTEDHLTLRNARFRDQVATLAAPMHGITKDELEGDDVREQHRTPTQARRNQCPIHSAGLRYAAGVFAFQQYRNAIRQRDTAILNQITVQADRLRGIYVSLAAQLDLTGYRMRPTPDLSTALITTGNAVLSTSLTGHINDVRSVVFSPDEHILASGGSDAMVRLWNVTDPAHPAPLGEPLVGHTNDVNSVVF